MLANRRLQSIKSIPAEDGKGHDKLQQWIEALKVLACSFGNVMARDKKNAKAPNRTTDKLKDIVAQYDAIMACPITKAEVDKNHALDTLLAGWYKDVHV